MLLKLIQRILLGVFLLTSLALFALPLVTPPRKVYAPLYEGFHFGWRLLFSTNLSQLGLDACRFLVCRNCGGKCYGYLDMHMAGCPAHVRGKMNVVEVGRRRRVIPGLELIKATSDAGFGVCGSFYLLSGIFSLYPAVTFLLWFRRRRRPLPGQCAKCSYNLTGNTSGVCPECGTPATPQVYKESSINQNS